MDFARQANHWLTKHDAGLMTAQDYAAFQIWLAADPRHAEAYGRAQLIFDAIAETPPRSFAPNESHSRCRLRARRETARTLRRVSWLGGTIAASLLLIAINPGDLLLRLQSDAIAATGETRRVDLPDGSVALLDSGGALAIDYSVQRRIRLLRGQAAFTVSPDRDRPFVVEARGGATTALGTRFIVSRIGPVTRVTVSEHAVRVSASGSVRDVSEGHSASYDGRGVSAPEAAHVADADAWTRGHLRFVDRPLREVVAELGRYHAGYIGMVGDELGDLRVNGVFPTRDPVSALDTIQRSLHLGSYRLGDRVIVLHR